MILVLRVFEVKNMNTYIAIALGALGGIYITYMHYRLTTIENAIATFPTPEEMAREVIKVKLPINELPPEVQEFATQMANTQQQGKPLPTIKGKESNYIG